jgi:cellulose synthase/poly-beta-1,6-N-acetylglucosamine synthase-like glycosyltransferase
VRPVFEVVVWVLGLYFAAYLIGSTVMTIVAAFTTRRARHRILPSTFTMIMQAEFAPTISVCIAAYNESAVVVDTVRSMLALDYPNVEVVLANDGSTDATLEVLRTEFGLQPSARKPLGELAHKPMRGVYEPAAPIPLVVLDKENGGRSDALNAAVAHAHGQLVAVMDADGVVTSDTLARAARPFLVDPSATVAVGANLGIANGCRIVHGRLIARDRPRQWLPLFQAIEYDRSFHIARVASGAIQSVPIVSGGFGLFRRDILVAAGGYSSETLGEDFDITLTLHRFMHDRGLPCRIAHIGTVVCWTIVPDTRRVLRRQRRRWHRGLQQVLIKHRRMTFRPSYRFLGMAALPWAWLYELFNPILFVLALVTTVVGYSLGYLTLHAVLLGAFVTWAFTTAPTLAALLMTDTPGGSPSGWKNLAAVVGTTTVDFLYQLLTLVYRLQALFSRGRVTWGEMERSLPAAGSETTPP